METREEVIQSIRENIKQLTTPQYETTVLNGFLPKYAKGDLENCEYKDLNMILKLTNKYLMRQLELKTTLPLFPNA